MKVRAGLRTELWEAGITNQALALEAVREAAGANPDDTVEPIDEITDAAMTERALGAGEVRRRAEPSATRPAALL